MTLPRKDFFCADLHCHTTCSDGTLTPEELVRHAKEIGLSGLAITDHDTVEAYQTAPQVAKEVGILLGTGVEFSTLFNEMSVHVLGYDFQLTHPELLSLCHWHRLRREKRNRVILEKLSQFKMPIEEKELNKKGALIGRPHIAQLMVEKGYVTSIAQAFQLYIGDDKPCFYRGESISTEETIGVIHRAGGKAFLAHPHLLTHTSKIKELIKLPFDGIECYYGKFSKDQEKRWIKLAQEKGLLISGGSDFHGAVKSYISLGCSWVDETSFHQIFTR
jgi:predicted metal-dependent phosphoesterase TrpH